MIEKQLIQTDNFNIMKESSFKVYEIEDLPNHLN